MAQIIGYFENNIKYTEGPFVAVNICGWRIEVEMKGHICPCLPDNSIYRMVLNEKGRMLSKFKTFKEIKLYIDWLNEQVKAGRIVLAYEKKIWVAYEYNKGVLLP